VPKVNYIDVDGERKECDVANGLSVMEGAVANGISGILAICGGSCACSTCHSYIDDAWVEKVGPPNEIEESTLELATDRRAGSRLTCQIVMRDDLDGIVVHVADNEN
jgi:ferredoxin, 2Fe-2S